MMINCEWGLEGVNKYSSRSDITIIVDVLSFSTSVDIALSRGAVVYPYRYKDESAAEYAGLHNAVLVSTERSKDKLSLSPYSLRNIRKDTKLVLPSPNGSELTMSSRSKITLCTCLRNFKAAAGFANSIGGDITVIPAGEKWENGTIRFAIEDYIGAGAVLSELKGNFSTEADAAIQVYRSIFPEIENIIFKSLSGRELTERGFTEDVELTVELNSGNSIPLLINNYYINKGA